MQCIVIGDNASFVLMGCVKWSSSFEKRKWPIFLIHDSCEDDTLYRSINSQLYNRSSWKFCSKAARYWRNSLTIIYSSSDDIRVNARLIILILTVNHAECVFFDIPKWFRTSRRVRARSCVHHLIGEPTFIRAWASQWCCIAWSFPCMLCNTLLHFIISQDPTLTCPCFLGRLLDQFI